MVNVLDRASKRNIAFSLSRINQTINNKGQGGALIEASFNEKMRVECLGTAYSMNNGGWREIKEKAYFS